MNTTIYHSRPWLNHYDIEVKPKLEYPDCALHDLLKKSADEFPQRAAIKFHNSEVNYQQLWNFVENFASALRSKGLEKGGRVGLAVTNSPTFIIAFYGILRAGGVVVAINPQYRENEFTFILNNAGVEMIVCQEENLALIERVRGGTRLRIAIISSILQDAEWFSSVNSRTQFDPKRPGIPRDDGLEKFRFLEMARRAPKMSTFPPINPAVDAAVFQYSGGTTGTPKAAVGLHRNLVANTVQFRRWLWSLRDGQETVLAAIPLYHVYGMVIALSVGVMLRATLLLEDDPRDLDRMLADIETHRPGLFPCVPSLFSGILQKVRAMDSAPNLTSLRVCISGSAPLLPTVKEAFENLTDGKVLEGYGLSEAPTATHCNPLGGANKIGSVGLPLPDVDCLLAPYLDDQGTSWQENTGELLIRGPQVMAGYFNAGSDDRDILKDGWLHTGDIASIDADGYFYILGRKKELIKVGGLQVWPAEIEEIISGHPAVKEVCIAGVPGPEKSEIVKAWVVLSPGAEATADGIRAWVRERLAAYKAPGLVEFRDSLPRTAVGKILRRELVREHLEKYGPN